MTRMVLSTDDLNTTDEHILGMLSDGRCTPRYIAGELDLQQPYVSQRLKRLVEHGHVERIDRGLYELGDDPRTDSHSEGEKQEQTQEPEPEPAPERVTTAPVGDIEAVVEEVAEGWDDTEHRLQQRKAAAQAAIEYAREHAGVSKQEAKEYVYPEQPVDGQNERTWYRKNIRPVLNEVAEYDQSGRKYVLKDEYHKS